MPGPCPGSLPAFQGHMWRSMGVRVSQVTYVRDMQFKVRMMSESDSAVCHIKSFRPTGLALVRVSGVSSQMGQAIRVQRQSKSRVKHMS